MKPHDMLRAYEKEARELLQMRNEAREIARHFDERYKQARKMIDGLKGQQELEKKI